MDETPASHSGRPLRIWPGVTVVVLQWLVRFGLPLIGVGVGTGIAGGMAGGLLVLVWWLFFSRAPWLDRVAAPALMVVALLVTSRFVHESIANGFQGMLLFIAAIPLLSLALVASTAAGRYMSDGRRRALTTAAVLLACACLTLIRTGGIRGDAASDMHWRWTETPEERLLASAANEPPLPPPPAIKPEDRAPIPAPEATTTPAPSADAATGPEKGRSESPAHPAVPSWPSPTVPWPGFRGSERDSVIRGVAIETDWAQRPPLELWRRPIGPGWSSFAVRGDLIYTQEQRGDDEVVSCYRLSTGEPVWRHSDAIRFWESNGGAGPRATPTVQDGRVYAVGATGIVNALDADSGAVLWSRNAAADTDREVPGWGITSSPLVIDDLVIVAAAGRLVAYDAASGTLRWVGPEGGGGYSSPHLATIDGVPQVILLRGSRTTSVAPADGALLWEHVGQVGVSIVQPALIPNGDVLITGGDAMGGTGIRRVGVAHGPSGWTVEERWTSRGLKPYFNDLVVHKGHAFGFDASILAAIDLNDGTRKWKGGRYGHGQLMLLADQDLLLVLSEEGELALVRAVPDQFAELARFPAIDGKTWNHPVLVGDVLLVRNGEEMAAFRLALSGR
jgi:outer membrane protein assembly factor BamB